MTEPNQEALSTNAQKIREFASGWIASADVKASALLAVAGAVLAIALASPVKGVPEAVLMGLFSVGTVVSIVASAFVIFPRTDRMAILRNAKCPDPLPRSPSFFSDLGELEFPGFTKFASEIDEATKRRDLLEQSYVMVVIARRKMRLMRIAVTALAISMIFLGAAVLASGRTSLQSVDEHADRKSLSSNASNVPIVNDITSSKGPAHTSGATPARRGLGAEIREPKHADDGGLLHIIDAGVQEQTAPSH